MDKPLYIKKLYKRYFDTLKSLLIYLNNKENLTLIEKEFVENLIYRGPIERFIPISKEDSNKPNFGIVPSSFYYSWSTNFPKNNVYLMNLKAGAEYCVRLFTNITSPEFGINIGNKKYSWQKRHFSAMNMVNICPGAQYMSAASSSTLLQ